MSDETALAVDVESLARVMPPDVELAAITVPIRIDPSGATLPVDETAVAVLYEGKPVGALELPPLRTMFRGDAPCDEIMGEPPARLVSFFICIERTAADWCVTTRTRVRDEEFEKIYSELRRRPDGRVNHPLFGYLRAAFRVAMALRPTSEAEFEQITRRLARSARTFRASATSTNYLDLALLPLVRG
ncbi:MAG: hypothetical protein R3A52_25880 [Polyangiales bacterium]